jgi:hypothetical protein
LNLRVLDSGDSDHAKLSQLHVANAELCDLLQEVLARAPPNGRWLFLP